jgi:pyridoxal phosphate enzyme (YggS family)
MSQSVSGQISRNIKQIREYIARAAESCGRRPEEVGLLAISKTFSCEAIAEAMAAGVRRFGESRIQEAAAKIPHFTEAISDCEEDVKFISSQSLKPEWHLVGHLQSNKTRRAVELFDVIQSVDSAKLAERINQASLELGKITSVLLQVDLGNEESKFGAEPDEIHGIIEVISGLKGIRLNALMALPPYFENQQDARPYFHRLRELGERLEAEQPGCLGERHLSMGMSHDFEAAVSEGATIVRVGTAIFGTR